MKRTVVIGLGNPILSDDAVGLQVVRALSRQMEGEDSVDIKEFYAGGIRLVEAMAGYDKALIVDAMLTHSKPGTIRAVGEGGFGISRNASSMHDISLATAIQMGRMLGLTLPTEIKVIGIEAKDVRTFGEALTEDVASAVPSAVSLIAEELAVSGIRK